MAGGLPGRSRSCTALPLRHKARDDLVDALDRAIEAHRRGIETHERAAALHDRAAEVAETAGSADRAIVGRAIAAAERPKAELERVRLIDAECLRDPRTQAKQPTAAPQLTRDVTQVGTGFGDRFEAAGVRSGLFERGVRVADEVLEWQGKPANKHGKEGVDGSSPSEGFEDFPA